MYLKVPVPANKGTRLLLRSTNASHLLLLISEPRLGWLDHQHPAAAQPKSPWEHPPADHPHRPGSHQQSHCPLSSFQKLNFAAHFDQIFYLKHMRSPPKTQPLKKWYLLRSVAFWNDLLRSVIKLFKLGRLD